MTGQIEDQSEPIVDVEYADVEKLANDNAEIEAEIEAAFNADPENVDYSISIYAAPLKGEKPGWLFDISPTELVDVKERLRDEVGSGTYIAYVRKGNRLHRRITYRIIAPKKDELIASPEMTPLLAAVQNQSSLLEALVAKVSEPPVIPVQNNPTEMMTTVIGMVNMVKDMMPQNSSPAFDPMQMFDLFTKGFEMARSNSDGDGETNVMDVIKTLISSPMLANMATAPQLPPPTHAVPQGAIQTTAPQDPVPGEPPPQTEAPKQDGIDPIVQAVATYIVNFIPQAERGADPGLYADMILDNVNPEMLSQVMTTPNIEQILRSSHPGIDKNWSWFADVFVYLTDAIMPEKPEGLTVEEKSVNGDATAVDPETSELKEAPAADVHVQPDPRSEPITIDGAAVREGGDVGNPKANVKAGKGRKKAPGNKGKSGGAGKVNKK